MASRKSERLTTATDCRRLEEALVQMCGSQSVLSSSIGAREMCVCVWVIKWKRMRWEGHVAHMEERRGVYRVLVGKPEGKRVPGVDGRIILRWIFRKWDVGVWTGSGWLRIGTGGGHL